MNVSEYMAKHGLTDADLDRMAAPYEAGDWEGSGGTVHVGSHVDAVGKKRVTVVYSASDAQAVASIARRRGVKPSEIYRDALAEYLDRARATA